MTNPNDKKNVKIMPCLDMQNGRVVKGIQFVNIRDAGDPVEAAKASWGCYMNLDELVRLVETLPAIFDRDSLPQLQYKPW